MARFRKILVFSKPMLIVPSRNKKDFPIDSLKIHAGCILPRQREIAQVIDCVVGVD